MMSGLVSSIFVDDVDADEGGRSVIFPGRDDDEDDEDDDEDGLVGGNTNDKNEYDEGDRRRRRRTAILSSLFDPSKIRDLPQRPQHGGGGDTPIPPTPQTSKKSRRNPNQQEQRRRKRKDDTDTPSRSVGSVAAVSNEEGKEEEDATTATTTTKKKKKKMKNSEEATQDDGNDDDDDEDDEERRTIFVGNLPIESATRQSLRSLFVDCGRIASVRLRGIPTTGVKLPPQHAGNQSLVKKVCANTNKVDASVKSNVVGYVVFQHRQSLEKALRKNNLIVSRTTGAPTEQPAGADHDDDVDVVRIRVDHVNPELDASRSVFVGNLPFADSDETSLRNHFCRLMKNEEEVEVEEASPLPLLSKDKINAAKSKSASFDEMIENVRIVRDPTTQLCRGFGYVLFRDRSLVSAAVRRLHQSTYQRRQIRVTVCGRRFKKGRGINANAGTPTATATDGTTTAISSSSSSPSKNRWRNTMLSSSSPSPSSTKNPKATAAAPAADDAVGALRRILVREAQEQQKTKTIMGGLAVASSSSLSSLGKKRKRGMNETNVSTIKKVSKTASAKQKHHILARKGPPGMSKRQASETKIEKRMKKLQKRASKGMGKMRQRS